MLATFLISASGAVILALGLAHLFYTFVGTKLLPRDAALLSAMQVASPNLTRKTTMWRAWVGFNASHSLGAILFGLLYIHLALWQAALLFGSLFLCGLGLACLLVYLWLGWRYWFSVPFRGIALATLLFTAGLVASRVV